MDVQKNHREKMPKKGYGHANPRNRNGITNLRKTRNANGVMNPRKIKSTNVGMTMKKIRSVNGIPRMTENPKKTKGERTT